MNKKIVHDALILFAIYRSYLDLLLGVVYECYQEPSIDKGRMKQMHRMPTKQVFEDADSFYRLCRF